MQRIPLPSSYARRLVAAIGSSPYGTSPCCIAKTAAAARVDTPILLYTFWMWLSAVLTEIPNTRAICFVCNPRARRRMTSVSRCVSPDGPSIRGVG